MENNGSLDKMRELFANVRKSQSISQIHCVYMNANNKLYKNNAYFHMAAALAYIDIESHEAAINALTQSISIKHNSSAYFFRGVEHQKIKQYSEAINDYLHCQQYDTENWYLSTTIIYMAYCHAKSGQLEKARSLLIQLEHHVGAVEYNSGMVSYCGGKVSVQIIEKLIAK